jgi:predicted nuclease of restriction endonuclease-like RecB superfamily
MLVGKQVRVRYARDKIVPCYLDPGDAEWREVADRLIALFRGAERRTRGELEQDVEDAFGDDPTQLVHQGLGKLLEDRCEFAVESGHSPEELREAVFEAAAAHRKRHAEVTTLDELDPRTAFDRDAVLREVAAALNLSPESVAAGLFADLKSEQRLTRFDDITPERLLERYNVALAQAVLLRAVRVHITICNEPPQRYRQLLRRVKFHRLVCEVERLTPETYQLHLDGPMSLFSATQKYGLQLALFLPALLHCRDFELKAELRWGAQRKPKHFTLTPRDGLVSHQADSGVYVPAELGMFVELFRKRAADWEIHEETEIYPLGPGFWVPDYRLVHRATGQIVLLEVLGFWRRSSAEQHLERLRQHVTEPFLLAVSDQLHIEDAELEDLSAGIHRFRNMPLPDEIARLGAELIGITPDAPKARERKPREPAAPSKGERDGA